MVHLDSPPRPWKGDSSRRWTPRERAEPQCRNSEVGLHRNRAVVLHRGGTPRNGSRPLPTSPVRERPTPAGRDPRPGPSVTPSWSPVV